MPHTSAHPQQVYFCLYMCPNVASKLFILWICVCARALVRVCDGDGGGGGGNACMRVCACLLTGFIVDTLHTRTATKKITYRPNTEHKHLTITSDILYIVYGNISRTDHVCPPSRVANSAGCANEINEIYCESKSKKYK